MSTAIIKNNIDIFANNLHEHIDISISNSQAPDNLKINKSIQKTNQKTWNLVTNQYIYDLMSTRTNK